MPIQKNYLKTICSRLLVFAVTAVVATSCIDWLPHAIAGFIYRSHLPTAPQKILALKHHDYARS